jgi:hypothetical protein
MNYIIGYFNYSYFYCYGVIWYKASHSLEPPSDLFFNRRTPNFLYFK